MNEHEHTKIDFDSIWFIAFVICIFAMMVVGIICTRNTEDKEWNNGYCPECGCKWEYQDMYHIHNGGNRYIYCDSEGHTIEISKNHGK